MYFEGIMLWKPPLYSYSYLQNLYSNSFKLGLEGSRMNMEWRQDSAFQELILLLQHKLEFCMESGGSRPLRIAGQLAETTPRACIFICTELTCTFYSYSYFSHTSSAVPYDCMLAGSIRSTVTIIEHFAPLKKLSNWWFNVHNVDLGFPGEMLHRACL